MDQALNQKIDAYIAENKEQLLQDIAALVAIDSVEGTPEEGAPFGAGPRAALDKTLELAAGMGFATRNCENYIAMPSWPVQTRKNIWPPSAMWTLCPWATAGRQTPLRCAFRTAGCWAAASRTIKAR